MNRQRTTIIKKGRADPELMKRVCKQAENNNNKKGKSRPRVDEESV